MFRRIKLFWIRFKWTAFFQVYNIPNLALFARDDNIFSQNEMKYVTENIDEIYTCKLSYSYNDLNVITFYGKDLQDFWNNICAYADNLYNSMPSYYRDYEEEEYMNFTYLPLVELIEKFRLRVLEDHYLPPYKLNEGNSLDHSFVKILIY